ncbi:MAG: CotH kinase family protein, partial [Oscillospiraceae bacterium]|nr:CotH kinase family protein [Oscillospiraceae bacterium]
MKAAELIKKYAVNIFAAAVCVFALSLPASAEKAVDTLAVEYLLPNGSAYTVKAFATDRNKIDEEDAEEIVEIPADNEYSIVLPYAVGGSSVTVKLADGASVEIDGQKLYNGSAFIPQKGVHTIVCEGEEYNLNVFYTSDLPVLYIETDQSVDYIHEDKHNSASGSIVVVNGSATEYDGVLAYIKGRGNATWKSPKKPYSIKLGKKASLFGMEKSKKYNLLAEYRDKSMLRNKLVLELAHSVGIEYCVDSQFVEVYYNNEYLGSYLLTEKVEVAEGRVDILNLEYVNEQSNPDTDLDATMTMSNYPEDEFYTPGAYKWCDIPNDLTSGLTGGYLLEIDTIRRYNGEASGFVTNYGEFVAIKGPEHATKGQVEYIRDYYQQFEDALLSDDGYNQLGKHYTEYADMESMAKMYVLQEYVQNLDAGMTSFYICKNEKGKLTMCSAWDFDNSLGANYIYHGFNLSNPDNVWVAQGGMLGEGEKRIIFSLLWRHEDFRREAARQWSEVFRPCINNLQESFEQSRVELYDTAVIRNYRRRKREYI